MQTAQQPLNDSYACINLPQLTLVGEHVRSLHQSRASGLVNHVFSRCVYAQFGSKLICIGLHELGGSSISALFSENVSRLPNGLTNGAQLQFGENSLFVNQCAVMGLECMASYKSPSLRLPQNRGSVNLPKHLLFENIPPDGLAPLLDTNVPASVQSGRLIAYTMPAVQSLLQQIRTRCLSDDHGSGTQDFNVEDFKFLFGAGPGLTPSGDDFIAGVFSALHLSNKTGVAHSLWQRCEHTAKACTTPLSFALLEQSAKDELSERLARIVSLQLKCSAALKSSNVMQKESRHITKQYSMQTERQLSKVGHTSGWDWYTGFLLCLKALN